MFQVSWNLLYHMTCSCMSDQQRHLKKSQEACLLACYDQRWVSYVVELSLTVHTLHIEKKPLLSVLSIRCSSGSEKAVAIGKWRQNFWTKHFQWKPHDKNLENTINHKEPYDTLILMYNEVCSRFRGNRQVDRQNDYCNPTGHVPRVKRKALDWNFMVIS